MSYWTAFHHVAIWGSIIYYFCFIVAMYASSFNYTYEGVAYQVFSSAQFWFTLLLTCTILLLPIIAYRFYYIDVHPTLTERIRLKQRLMKSKSRSKDFHIRRASTLRRSTRSLRSGYAFAHQEGFGELITSGLNMRQRVEKSEQKNPVELTKVSKIDSAPLPSYNDLYVENNNSNSASNAATGDSGPTEGVEENHNPSHPHYHDPDRHVVFCEKL